MPSLDHAPSFFGDRAHHLVTFGIAQLREFSDIDVCVELQLRKRSLLQHLAVQIERLQLNNQTCLAFTPDPVSITQAIDWKKLKHV
jgi:hypothetical protein